MSHLGLEHWLGEAAGWTATCIEAVMIALIVFGAAVAVHGTARLILRGTPLDPPALRTVWLRFAAWILLAAEFALAADLIRTVVAPTWEELGKLGTIALIRTVLGYALGHDLLEAKEAKKEAA